MNKRANKIGFSIVELLVVIVILSTFALLGSFGYNKLKDRRINEKARTNAESIASALDEVYMAGQTSDGVEGVKGGYPSFVRACSPDGAKIINKILQKQKAVDKDAKVGFLFDQAGEHPELISHNLSGCEVLPNGEISRGCVDESLSPVVLVTCDVNYDLSFEDAKIDASDPDNLGTIVYQPITNKRASMYDESANMTWQCMYDEYDDPCMYGGCHIYKKETPTILGMKSGIVLAGTEVNPVRRLSVPIQPNIRLAIVHDPEEEATSGPTSCRGFYIYYLERSGGKIKLSEAVTGRY
ncbi:MAG: type II secretion system protein [Candidatus Nanosyncoccaceae bacterium]|jgi:type II secretory pathway pseudopilin PulG